VVPTGVAVAAEPLGDEPSGGGDQLCRGSNRVVGTEHADRGRHSTHSQAAEPDWRDPGLGPGFPAAAGQVNVAVHQARDDSASLEVMFLNIQAGGQRRGGVPSPDDRLTCNQQVLHALWLGCVEDGVP
jgi:hypothetical protein